MQELSNKTNQFNTAPSPVGNRNLAYIDERGGTWSRSRYAIGCPTAGSLAPSSRGSLAGVDGRRSGYQLPRPGPGNRTTDDHRGSPAGDRIGGRGRGSLSPSSSPDLPLASGWPRLPGPSRTASARSRSRGMRGGRTSSRIGPIRIRAGTCWGGRVKDEVDRAVRWS